MIDPVIIPIVAIAIGVAVLVVLLPSFAENKYRLFHRCPRCHSISSMLEFKTHPLIRIEKTRWEVERLCEKCREKVEHFSVEEMEREEKKES